LTINTGFIFRNKYNGRKKMKLYDVFSRGIVLGLLVLLIGAGIMPGISGKTERSIPDPDVSTVELTATSHIGMTTCPAGDGQIYEFLKVTVKDAMGTPMVGLPSALFQFNLAATPGTTYYNVLSCTFTPVTPAVTDANGEIKFTILGDTSMYGNITIQVVVLGVPLSDIGILPVKTVDITNDGIVSLGDFSYFGQQYTKNNYRCDFTWDLDHAVTLGDFSYFGQHYTHEYP